MAQAIDMLETHPRSLNTDAGLLASAIDALAECASTCTQCADACLAENDVAPLVECIRLNLDCADICEATSRVVARQAGSNPDVVRAQLQACIKACRACGDECERHGMHMEHCRICAESCRRCEEACRQLLVAMA